MTIHWCGTGLSAIPGLRELIQTGQPVTVWNRTVEKAQDAVGDLTQDIKPFEPATIEAALQPGDVIVSMLPGDWHVPLAEMALAKTRILSARPISRPKCGHWMHARIRRLHGHELD